VDCKRVYRRRLGTRIASLSTCVHALASKQLGGLTERSLLFLFFLVDVVTVGSLSLAWYVDPFVVGIEFILGDRVRTGLLSSTDVFFEVSRMFLEFLFAHVIVLAAYISSRSSELG